MIEWDPTRFFRADTPPTPFALLVLNQPINEKAFVVLREHACFTVCADGGANRLYDLMQKQGRESTTLPDAIIGDLDSIRPPVHSCYEELGVTIAKDDDQYSTDFTKCLKYLQKHAPSGATGKLDILILGGLGGRVDQAFSQIHHLYLMAREYSSIQSAGNLYLVSEESLTFILQPGRNVIRTPGTRIQSARIDDADNLLEENVGIIPLTGPARITTKGFEWDVQDWPTEIGGQLSTSNHIRDEVVEVEGSVAVLFTLELATRFKRAILGFKALRHLYRKMCARRAPRRQLPRTMPLPNRQSTFEEIGRDIELDTDVESQCACGVQKPGPVH